MTTTQEDEVEAARLGNGSFPRGVPEDCVEYFIYYLDSTISDIQRRDKLREIQAASTALVKKHLKDYIWEQEVYNLSLGKKDGQSYLHGRTSYGDSIEDEWIIVWLLTELSKQFDQAWSRVIDTDGEFLLIEAANSLPKWLNPEVADYRVWLNDGHVHVIPKTKHRDLTTEQYSGSLTLPRALEYLGKNKVDLLSDPKIEQEAFYRIKKYPAGIADSFHHSLVKIPRKIALLLHKSPSYISPAVESFYLRDPIALKPLQRTDSKESLTFPPVDLVLCRIKFTKVGFAKLRSQQFPYPSSWSAVEETANKDSKVMFQAEMGMKLSCGFEMLVSDPQNKDKKVVREIGLIMEDLAAGEEQLPSDSEIQSWGTTEDSDAWLDIDYQDFEKELSGQRSEKPGKNGFGSADAQDKLRKMVSRFEDLMADDDAEDPDIDEMNKDNDPETDVQNSDSESHNSAEEDFNEMMREMLGMDKETMDELMGKLKAEMESKGKGEATGVVDEDSDDEEEIRELSKAMEAELRASGALKLDPGEKKTKSLKTVAVTADENDEEESSDEEYLDEDYNLAKNMLEAFKSQAGAAGPAGNLMSMLNVQMPRDEHDSD